MSTAMQKLAVGHETSIRYAPGVASTVIESALVAEAPPEPVTLTVNACVPATVGVPAMCPVEGSSARPVGSVPVSTLHVYGAVPPRTARASS
jgi:hypothetical protein